MTGPQGMPEAVAMTDLAEQLRSPAGEALRRDIVERLDALTARIAEATRIGVASADYGRLQKIERAADTARRIVLAYR